MADYKCPLCGGDARNLGPHPEHPRKKINGVACERCGTYYLTLWLSSALSDERPATRAKVSAVTREHSEQGRPITLFSSSFTPGEERIGFAISEVVETMFPRSIPERIDRALLNLARESQYAGSHLNVTAPRDCPLLFAEDRHALEWALRSMVQSGLLDRIPALPGQRGGLHALSVKGWERVEALGRLQPQSRQAFVAMWFDPEMDDAYQRGLEPAIQDAGYTPRRVDLAQFNGKIDDFIIAEIRRSRFAVVDVTGHRQAVYFEAGFAMALGLPVIFTCHKDDLEACSFDTRQHNHIVWETPDDLKQKLKNRIDATIV